MKKIEMILEDSDATAVAAMMKEAEEECTLEHPFNMTIMDHVSTAPLMELRRSRERGLEVVQVIDGMVSHRHILVVLRQPAENHLSPYHCYRYFPIGNNWEVSYDLQDADPSQVMAWLEDPKAM